MTTSEPGGEPRPSPAEVVTGALAADGCEVPDIFLRSASQRRRHRACRDDDVDQWLRRTRDSLLALGNGRDTVLAAQAVDDLLNDYRLHADEGTPLDAEASQR